jgi:hypothetical protein
VNDYRRTVREAEYQRLERFALALIECLAALGHLPGLAPAFRDGLEAARSRDLTTRLSGVRQAANDLLEMTRDLTVEELAQADRFLQARNAETLTAVRRDAWNQVPRILRRGHIRSRAEYDLLQERLIQGDDYNWNAGDRERAAELVAAYEAAQA